jgi:hypothetical protein
MVQLLEARSELLELTSLTVSSAPATRRPGSVNRPLMRRCRMWVPLSAWLTRASTHSWWPKQPYSFTEHWGAQLSQRCRCAARLVPPVAASCLAAAVHGCLGQRVVPLGEAGKGWLVQRLQQLHFSTKALFVALLRQQPDGMAALQYQHPAVPMDSVGGLG